MNFVIVVDPPAWRQNWKAVMAEKRAGSQTLSQGD
jgi:hypothetical protein